MAVKHERESGIELLRILAMLLIVIGHVPHFYSFGPTCSGFALALLANAGRIAVNLFLLVGVWFMVDAPFRAERPLRLYLTVLTYAVPLTLVGWIAGMLPATKDVVRCFVPFLGRPLWFVSAYVTLLLLSPYLAILVRAVGSSFGRFVFLVALSCAVCSLPDPQLTYFGDTAWFVFVYLFMSWLKRTPFLQTLLRWRGALLVAGLAGYAALVACSCFGPDAVATLADQYLFDFKTIPNFLISLMVFCFFAGLRLGAVPLINAVAKPTLAVYIFHQMPSFVPALWGALLPVERLRGAPCAAGSLILAAVAVYAMASVLEVVRMRLVEPGILRSRGYAVLVGWIERFYAPVARNAEYDIMAA